MLSTALSKPTAPNSINLWQWIPSEIPFSSHFSLLSLLWHPLDCVQRRLNGNRIGWRRAGVHQFSGRGAQETFRGGLEEPDTVQKWKRKKKQENKTEQLCPRIMFCSWFSCKECKYLPQKNILPFLINCQKDSKISICFYGNLSLSWGTSYYSNLQTLTSPNPWIRREWEKENGILELWRANRNVTHSSWVLERHVTWHLVSLRFLFMGWIISLPHLTLTHLFGLLKCSPFPARILVPSSFPPQRGHPLTTLMPHSHLQQNTYQEARGFVNVPWYSLQQSARASFALPAPRRLCSV